MFRGLRGVVVTGADRGLGIVQEEFGGFFDAPSRGNGLQNVADIDLRIGAEVSRPATIVKAQDHNVDDAAHKARSRQERFVLPRYHRTATLIRHRFPAVPMSGKLCKADTMEPIDAVQPCNTVRLSLKSNSNE